MDYKKSPNIALPSRGTVQLRWMKFVIVAFLSLATVAGTNLFVGSVTYAKPNSTAQEVNAYLNAYEELGWFSGSVLVAQGNKILLSQGYGMADYAHRVPITPVTEYGITGLTKQFTAMAILQLQQKGLLNVNDQLGKYLPQYPQWKDITIKQLLTQTSGIPNYTSFVSLKTLETVEPVQKMIGLFQSKPLDFTPGTDYSYSNSGYLILGCLLQNLTGMSYANYLEKNIFTPLDMKHTGLFTPSHMPDMATGYAYTGVNGNGAEPAPSVYTYGDFGLYSTTEDLYQWDRALYSTKLASARSLKQMFSPETTQASYGYGWDIGWWGNSAEKADKLEYNLGYVPGYDAFIVRDPSRKISITLLSNTGTAPVKTLMMGLMQIVIGHSQPAFPSVNNHFITLKNSQVFRYVGRYELHPSIPSAKPQFITVTEHGNQLYANGFGLPTYSTGGIPIYPTAVSIPIGFASFVPKLIDATLMFNLTLQGKVTGINIQEDGGLQYDLAKVK